MSVEEFKALIRDTISYIKSTGLDKNTLKHREFGKINVRNLMQRNGIKIAQPQQVIQSRPNQIPQHSSQSKSDSLQCFDVKPKTQLSHTSMMTTLKRLVPQLELLPPSPPMLFVTNDQKDERAFLEKVAKALEDSLCSAKVVNQSELELFLKARTLKFVIASLQTLNTCFSLKQEGQIHTVVDQWNGIALFTLAPFSDYLNNIDLKRDLWTKLKLML